MIDKLKIRIPFDWTAKHIIEAFMQKGPKFLSDTLRKYAKNMLGEVTQNPSQVTFCGKIEKEDGEISLAETPLKDLYNKYRAYALRPKIYFFLDQRFGSHQGKRIVVEELILDEKLFVQNSTFPLVDNNL